jgi:hypothetical protein
MWLEACPVLEKARRHQGFPALFEIAARRAKDVATALG